jgi:hypothetical protein
VGVPLTGLSFEDWLAFVFDHPVNPGLPEWYWDMEAAWWDGRPVLTVSYLSRLFENAGLLLANYSDAQVNQGLWYLCSNSCSDHMLAILDASVSEAERLRCVSSFKNLYEGCFLPRCTPHLSHLDEPGAGALNPICYMWWDIIPIYGKPSEPGRAGLDQQVLSVLAYALQLDSVACQESALHGLGHWAMYYRDPVQRIIDRFLQSRPGLPETLRTYALSARSGHVL